MGCLFCVGAYYPNFTVFKMERLFMAGPVNQETAVNRLEQIMQYVTQLSVMWNRL